MELVWNLVIFGIGILLVVKGGDIFVDAAAGLAKGLGLPSFVVGATVVSLATTLPEIMVSVLAAAQGRVEMAVGNALGSVTANTALILATGMVLLPNADLGKGIKVPCGLLMAAMGSLWLACAGGRLYGWRILLPAAVCAGFLWYNVHRATNGSKEAATGGGGRWLWKFLLGAAAIVAGSQLLVTTGEAIALRLGIPEGIIAVTLLALGTCLPELVTTLTAIKKGEAALSVGNVIGANIIDLTLILPLSALASGGGLPLSEQTVTVAFPGCAAVMAVAAVPLLLWGRSSRVQGVLLWLLYGCYLLCMV